MTLDELKAYLIAQEDPDFVEKPPYFDGVDAERRYGLVVAELEAYFGKKCCSSDSGGSIQDAAFFAEVGLPKDLFEDAVLRFSAFGNMVAFRDESELDEKTLRIVEDILSKHGFIFIPLSVWGDLKYEGKYAEACHHSWWHRFFCYV